MCFFREFDDFCFLIEPLHSTEEFLTRVWYRTGALQCCHGQPSIDKVIPMYKLGDARSGAKPAKGWMSETDLVSYILVSDRAREESTQRDLNSVTPKSIGTGTGNPYITILLDLRIGEDLGQSKLESRSQSKSKSEPKPKELIVHETDNPAEDGPCLRIYAPGIHTDIYPFMAEVEGMERLLKRMLKPPVRWEERTPSAVRLRDQTFVAHTTTTRHMSWGEGDQRSSESK